MPQHIRPDLVERRGTGEVAVAVASPAKFDHSTAESISQPLSTVMEVPGQNHLVRSFNGRGSGPRGVPQRVDRGTPPADSIPSSFPCSVTGRAIFLSAA